MTDPNGELQICEFGIVVLNKWGFSRFGVPVWVARY